jgi:hypothetical protein
VPRGCRGGAAPACRGSRPRDRQHAKDTSFLRRGRGRKFNPFRQHHPKRHANARKSGFRRLTRASGSLAARPASRNWWPDFIGSEPAKPFTPAARGAGFF